MKEIKVKKLDKTDFEKYGRYTSPYAMDEYCFDGGFYKFHRDMIQQNLVRESTVSYSFTFIDSRPLILDSLEFHDYCEEMIFALDGDVLMCVAPAVGGDSIPMDEVECFYVPQGTFVVVKQGVWHGMPFSVNDKPVRLLCMLPERTYKKDCTVVPMSGEDRIKILKNGCN